MHLTNAMLLRQSIYFFKFCINYIIYFCFGLVWVFIAAWDFSLLAASRGLSLVVVCVRLSAVVSLIVERGLPAKQASVEAACGLRLCGAEP